MSPRLSGVVLALTVVVATLWLAATNQLILYIHPRYVVFTVIMAVLALAVAVASFATYPDDHDEPAPRGWRRILSFSALALTLVIAVGLVVVPPATLTSATVSSRDLNSTGAGAEVQSIDEAAAGDDASFARFTVRDWASLLGQTSDPAFYASKPVDVTGFITSAGDDDIFYVSRFVITCCAVDAQPVGVPVYLPNWSDEHEVDDWVHLTGEFTSNPSSGSAEPLAVVPATVERIGTPDEPYLF